MTQHDDFNPDDDVAEVSDSCAEGAADRKNETSGFNDSFISLTIEARRRLAANEPFDDLRDVVDSALQRQAAEAQIPCWRDGELILFGTEKWKHLGAAQYRTVLKEKEISAFEVVCSASLDPETIAATDKDRLFPVEQATDFLYGGQDNSYKASIFGPSYGGSRQELMREAPDTGSRPSVIQQAGKFIEDLQNHGGLTADEKLAELERWMDQSDLPAGDVIAAHSVWLRSQYYGGRLRSIKDERRRVADQVIRNCRYFREKLAASESLLSRQIAAHLSENCKIGINCRYDGDWPWQF